MKNVKEIEYKIEGEKWQEALDKAFNKKVKDVEIDGFRKGKCPKNVYLSKFGTSSLYQDAIDVVLDESYVNCISENNLKPAIPGDVSIVSISDDELVLKFKVVETPEIKLGEYTNLGIKKKKAKVTDEEINAEIESMRSELADIVEEDSGKVSNGDTAVIDFTGYVDGKLLDGGTGENYELTLGSNTFIPGFEDGVVGMEVGEEKELNLKFPEEYTEDLKNKDVLFKVKLNSIKRKVLPEVNEEFFKDAGYEKISTLDELKEEVKNHLLEHKNEEIESNYENEVFDKAVSNMEVEINDEIVDYEIENMINYYKDRVEQSNIQFEQYLSFMGQTLDSFKESLKGEAVKTLKRRYLLNSIIEKENFDVTDDELKNEYKIMADMYGISVEEVSNMGINDEQVKANIRYNKAIELLKK